ncbi:acyl carrier protein [Streptomyces clavuligerus]|uniref:Polyketide synthase n=1 Tax=Streptomyces clavuligerus TaxID=1901 RepID=B5GL46_STRCL|nr:acyl carrier protein [Streptomyces clavuligerus]ANW18068.1 acyl carrier protein [Streptomyces clavuligerus]AXU12627.1 acyl carrier protein [Streptomyces clavuligerus]EDY47042.1 hypothetical protein SSCG_00070 [Streptomyces clavuligerus]EFG09351.1 Polyketide synthase [Streptomyces clavuligerus]MBY6302529.1 acyl carrier protein [Streptomyces clavuligerus]
MTEKEFIDVLAPLMEEIIGTTINETQLDITFGDLDVDSLNQIEIITRIEDAFDCEIDDSTLRTIRTPRGVMEYIAGVSATR